MGDIPIDKLPACSYNNTDLFYTAQEVTRMSHSEHSHTSPENTENNCAHHHEHTQTRAVINRLSRAIGHLESVKRMVEHGQDCSDVLIQLAAVKSAINNTGKLILKDHIEHCLTDAVENGDQESIERLSKAIERFIK